MSNEINVTFLAEQQKNFLIDGYCRQHKKNQQYIAVELCNVILLYLRYSFDFVVIFEKKQNDYFNDLYCFDLKSKNKLTHVNKFWKHHPHAAYCLHETSNDYLVYRVGGYDNDAIPNIMYSVKSNKATPLELTQTSRSATSLIYNSNFGLVAIGGCDSDDKYMPYVEIMKNKQKDWTYLSTLNTKRGNASAATIGDKIFVFGGYNEDNAYLNSTEMYDLNNGVDTEDNDILLWFNKTNKGKWINLTSQKFQKCSSGVKYDPITQAIILVGGFNQDFHNENEPRSFVMFDILKNEFIEYPKTTQQHAWKPAVSIENETAIYVIGNDGRANEKWGVIEMFDRRENKWSQVDELGKALGISSKDAQKRLFQTVLNCA